MTGKRVGPDELGDLRRALPLDNWVVISRVLLAAALTVPA
jgi:hypothetical protein